MNAHGQTIGLNMIVKEEARVFRRCIDSPRGLIERPWVDFPYNRTGRRDGDS